MITMLYPLRFSAIILLAVIASTVSSGEEAARDSGGTGKKGGDDDTCRLYMATSTIPNAGVGMFTTVVSDVM